MNCPRCGSKIKTGEMFCSNCGTPISSTQKGYPAQGFGGGAPKPTRGKGAWIAGIIVAVMALSAVIALMLLASPTAGQNLAGGLSAGDSTHVVGGQIGTDGGTISIDEGELSGFSIDVIEDSFGESVQFDISTAPIESHEFGDIFTAASPLITIDNGGIYADKPMMVTIPINIEDDEFAMAFFYDEETRQLQPMPLFSLTNTELVTMTQHFSDILVSKIKKDKIVMVYDTKFTPGVDDFQMGNRGSYLDPKGYCGGECVAMAYYYEKKELNQGVPLHGRFDNDGVNKTPGFKIDDADAIRLCACLQGVFSHLWDTHSEYLLYYRLKHDVNDTQTYYAILYSMMATKQPQIIVARDKVNGHAVLAYKITEDAIWVADPNNPGNTAKSISIQKSAHGAIEFSKYGSCDRFGFLGMYAMTTARLANGLWREVIDGSPMLKYSISDFFPKDVVIDVVVGKDERGEFVMKPLADGLLLTKDAVAQLGLGMGQVFCCGIYAKTDNDKVYIYRDTEKVCGIESEYISFKIEEGVTKIGICYVIKTDKGEGYVNFHWYDVIYGEMKPTLTANPGQAETAQQVSFKIDSNSSGMDFNASAYTYKWDFGNGRNDTTNGVASNTYIYSNEGTYAVNVGIYNNTGEYLGKAETTVTVTVTPEPTLEATPEHVPMAVPAYLCGTWEPKYERGDMLDTDTFDIWRLDQTLEIYEDGTCYYSRIFTNLYKREDETDPNATLPPYDDTCESSAFDMTDVRIYGQLTLYDEEYSETGAQAIGMITFDYDSRWYDSDLYLDDGKFIFLGVEYIRSE